MFKRRIIAGLLGVCMVASIALPSMAEVGMKKGFTLDSNYTSAVKAIFDREDLSYGYTNHCYINDKGNRCLGNCTRETPEGQRTTTCKTVKSNGNVVDCQCSLPAGFPETGKRTFNFNQ